MEQTGGFPEQLCKEVSTKRQSMNTGVVPHLLVHDEQVEQHCPQQRYLVKSTRSSRRQVDQFGCDILIIALLANPNRTARIISRAHARTQRIVAPHDARANRSTAGRDVSAAVATEFATVSSDYLGMNNGAGG